MKRILLTMMVVLAAVVANAQEEEFTSRRHPAILPGRGHLNLEAMLNHIDTDMDISKLSLSELRVLRNAFAARQGYVFNTAELRCVFSGTTWYNDLMWERWYKEQELGDSVQLPLNYTPKESAFIKRIQAREKQLLKQNFKATGGRIVNTDNIINPFQLESIDPALDDMLGRQGFAIVPQKMEQLFHIYERNAYHNFPSFVTTDLYLQAFHMYFDCLTREVEGQSLHPAMVELCREMYKELRRVASTTTSSDLRLTAERGAAYFAIALATLTDEPLPDVSSDFKQQAEQEVDNIQDYDNRPSTFLNCTRTSFAYSLFRPRGHYTRSETLQRYFRGMMWLQTAPFKLNADDHLAAAALVASTLASNQRLTALYDRVNEPLTFLFGAPDNITMQQLHKEMTRLGLTPETLAGNAAKLQQLREAATAVAKQQTRIGPKDDAAVEYAVNLMPQRYMPDAEVLQEMIDHDGWPSQRACSKGLDVLAAMGVPAAERILLQELKEQQGWSGYTDALKLMKQRMKEINWDETVSTQWMSTLKSLCLSNDAHAPYFMKTPQWNKKNLNTALASWAELKHDAILYAKQPMGAECGDDGPPEPVVKAYVEPNVSYWQLAATLIDATERVLDNYQLATEKTHDISEELREKAQFLLKVSQKELNGTPLTRDEYDAIKFIGASFENLTLELLRQGDTGPYEWIGVQGPDRSIAVVADVLTSTYRNVPDEQKSILYEAVGPAYEIYVVVEIEGLLYLTRGAVFSYREFQRSPNEQRLTDEEWQEQLKQQPRAGEPEWMKEIIAPVQQPPVDDETFFFSSGC